VPVRADPWDCSQDDASAVIQQLGEWVFEHSVSVTQFPHGRNRTV
jgi:hypothetical protein